SVGLTATIGHFFNKISKDKIKYETIVIISTIISITISNIGVESIITFADPILKIVYPIAIVLVIINVFVNLIEKKRIYIGTISSLIINNNIVHNIKKIRKNKIKY